MLVQSQKDIERLDGGASAYIYAVDDEIALKSPVTYVPPTKNSSSFDHYEYALSTVCLHEDIENERRILSVLLQRPHGNILQPVSVEFDEGIYLHRHLPFSSLVRRGNYPTSTRIRWYEDMLKGLVHLHEFQIAHADLRIDNFLYDKCGRVVLCDFSCSRRFGEPNPLANGIRTSLSLNGNCEFVSQSTDMFALASVIYEVETGLRPHISMGSNGSKFPPLNTGSATIDSVILNAWSGRCSSTILMLNRVQSLTCEHHLCDLPSLALDNHDLLAKIEDWRYKRKLRLGMSL